MLHCLGGEMGLLEVKVFLLSNLCYTNVYFSPILSIMISIIIIIITIGNYSLVVGPLQDILEEFGNCIVTNALAEYIRS